MKILVVGTGYVGLVTGTCLAETGNEVSCVDIDVQKVQQLQEGQLPIYEPGLGPLFRRNVQAGRLHFVSQLATRFFTQSSIIFLALPTPPTEDGAPNISFLLQAVKDIAKMLQGYKAIVIKSTVPVGTNDTITKVIQAHSQSDFDVISNPEFLREGLAVDDFMRPDRVVVGACTERAHKLMAELYAPYLRQGNPLIFMDPRSAELTKYAANALLATKISFINEIANLCELVGADADHIRRGIGTDERIGKRFLFPGIGYGGSCFPKDIQALTRSFSDNNCTCRILEAVMEVNKQQRKLFVDKVRQYYQQDLKGRRLALWGLSFKPETDDIREAPSLYIIDELLKDGASICVFDPEAMPSVKKLLGTKVAYAIDPYNALEGADALLIITEWPVFRTPNFDQMGKLLKSKVIFDGRNLYRPQQMIEQGFYYNSVGRTLVQ